MLLEQLPPKAQGCSPIAEVWALLPGWGVAARGVPSPCREGLPSCVPHGASKPSLSLRRGEPPVGLEKPGWCLGGFKGSLKWLQDYNGAHSGREPLRRRTRGRSHTLEIWARLFRLHTCK